MADPHVSERMRDDWNDRAREDAHYYVAFGSKDQDEAGFESTAAEVVAAIEWELKRLPGDANRRSWRALEIGCGPGRLIKPLSRNFGEIHGVDVSDEMVRLARQRLQGIPHAHVHATNGASLSLFADESFEIVYSYAVFQHIPSRDVVLEYMHETQRVLKPGGIFRGQFNGVPPEKAATTWSGVGFSPEDIRAFTGANRFQLLALEGAHTQYMWTTWRKRLPQTPATVIGNVSIRRVTNASSSEPVVPDRGPLAAISIWVTGLPDSSDLNSLEVLLDGVPGTGVYIGPREAGGLQQVNVMLPAGVRTGLIPVELLVSGVLLGQAAFVRVIPAGPLTPRILAVTDGINVIYKNRSTTGSVKVQLEEILQPETVSATISGQPVREFEIRCTDPLPPRHEVNFRLPEGLPQGLHELRIAVGRRTLSPVSIEVAT
jgi:SAM-dependent methyltransferase